MGELAPSSADQIRNVLRSWMRHAGPPPWPENMVADWVNDGRLRPTTRKARLSRLRPFCRWLILDGHIGTDPTLRIGRIVVPSSDPRDLTPDEVRRLIGACPDDRAVIIVILMVQMGLRAGDVARARVEDIDQHRQLLHVRAKGGRGEPTHWEPIPAEAWALLSRWLDQSPSGGPLIRSQGNNCYDGLTPNHIGRLVRGWLRDAGLKARAWDGRSAHSLRHSCAQHMIDGGADLREVQHTLGHRTIRSTELYIRREPPGLRTAMEGRRYMDAA